MNKLMPSVDGTQTELEEVSLEQWGANGGI